eukprot:3759889-Pyramimonas_sp.AAC.1
MVLEYKCLKLGMLQMPRCARCSLCGQHGGLRVGVVRYCHSIVVRVTYGYCCAPCVIEMQGGAECP